MKIRINSIIYVIFYMMLFLSIIPYDITKVLPSTIGNIIIYIIRIIVLIYGLMLLCKKRDLCIKRKKIIKITSIYFAVTFTVNILATLLNSQVINFFALIKRSSSILFTYFSIIVIIYNLSNKEYIIKGLKNATLLLVIISCILYVFVPNVGKYYAGLGEYTFLGIANNRNGYIEFALALIVCLLYQKEQKMSIVNIVLVIFTLYTIILTKSATSIIMVFFSLSILIIEKILKSKFNYNNIIKMIFAVWIIYICALSFNFEFTNLGHFFNKSVTLTGRTYIWNQSIIEIKKHLFIGYGYGNDVLKNISNSLYYKYFALNDTHNAMLYLLMSSGIIGTLATLMYIIFIIKNAKVNYDTNNKYLYIYILASLVRGLTESCLHYSHVLFYIILILVTEDNREGIKKQKGDCDG